MNSLIDDFRKAKIKKRRFYAGITLVIAAAFVGLFGFIILSKGVPVEVSPPDAAAIAVVRVKQGAGFSINQKVYFLAADITARVSAPGFIAKELRISRGQRDVKVVLEEMPGTLHVTTDLEDDATRWYLNDKLITTATNFSMELKSDNYRLLIDHRYRQKYEDNITIARGQELNLQVRLPPLVGELRVNAIPAAAVHIDGEDESKTPATYRLAGGEYTITVGRPGYKPITDTIRITNAMPLVSREYKLAVADAFVNFQLAPARGVLLVDGKLLHSFERVRVDALSEHTASYIREGYVPATQNFSVKPGETETVRFSLRKEFGMVEIRSTPNAAVTIDGKAMGNTPISTKLSAVEHRVVISKKGYETVTRKITPSAKESKRIDVGLATELQAQLNQTPGTYTNSVGMTMKLFQPGAFRSGAPRHEKGQRANEFQRNIELTKRFYAALHETTVGQFNAYRGGATDGARAELALANVAWVDAAMFCNWLSARENFAPFYRFDGLRYVGGNIDADGYRLPTEAEWEWLARKAGRQQQTRFVWGDENAVPASAGNLADESAKGRVPVYISKYNDGFPTVAPVGGFAADFAGLYDLSGNLSEWIHDFYALAAPIGNRVETDPVGPVRGIAHVIKGSSWRSGNLTELRASFREEGNDPRDDIGFRVVRYWKAHESN